MGNTSKVVGAGSGALLKQRPRFDEPTQMAPGLGAVKADVITPAGEVENCIQVYDGSLSVLSDTIDALEARLASITCEYGQPESLDSKVAICSLGNRLANLNTRLVYLNDRLRIVYNSICL